MATKQEQTDSRLELEQLNIDGYQVDEVIQSGGMGDLYQGRHVALDRVVVLKLLKKELCSNDIHMERFRREARTGASISHPNVVRVYDAGESSSGDFYFVMEKIHSDLTILLDRKKLSLQQVGHLFRQICIGLDHIHEMGILHRDLKPSNLFVDEDLNLKIGDFGIAKREEVQPIDALTTTNQVLGTPTFMAPELAEPKSKQGRCTDIFALGVILFQMFVGSKGIRPAFTIASVRGRAYQAIDVIVRKATAVCPEHRYREALEMLADFEKVVAKLKVRILIKKCLPYFGAILILAGLGFALFLLRNN